MVLFTEPEIKLLTIKFRTNHVKRKIDKHQQQSFYSPFLAHPVRPSSRSTVV